MVATTSTLDSLMDEWTFSELSEVGMELPWVSESEDMPKKKYGACFRVARFPCKTKQPRSNRACTWAVGGVRGVKREEMAKMTGMMEGLESFGGAHGAHEGRNVCTPPGRVLRFLQVVCLTEETWSNDEQSLKYAVSRS
ncbi:hypothetical protein EDB83DRAFT_2316033 [Lactarius deliciosus]|nr:hypothetical protein EDB83DRAFT_2316033 [Lactarius deliciosus]